MRNKGDAAARGQTHSRAREKQLVSEPTAVQFGRVLPSSISNTLPSSVCMTECGCASDEDDEGACKDFANKKASKQASEQARSDD